MLKASSRAPLCPSGIPNPETICSAEREQRLLQGCCSHPGGGLSVGPWASPAAAALDPWLSWAERRRHCSRPTLASSQPPASRDSKSVVPQACSSSPPAHCSSKSHSCSGGTHRSPQAKCPCLQESWSRELGGRGWGTGAQGPGGSGCRVDTSVGAELGQVAGMGSAVPLQGKAG